MFSRAIMSRLDRTGLALTLGLLAMSLASTAQATLLWYDGFATPTYVPDTSNATPLNGQSGGTGTFFTGPWADAPGNDHHVDATSLPHGDLVPGAVLIHPSVGGSAVGTDTPGGCCDTARDARQLSSPWDGFTNPDGTFYMGFLVNYGVGPTIHHRVLEMWDGDQGNDSNRNLQLGYSEFTGVGTADGAGKHMGISVHDSNANSNVNQDLIGGPVFQSDGKTHLMVLRFDLSNSGNDRIRAYLDPIGTAEPGSAAADISVGEFLVDRMGAVTDFTFGDTQKASAIDEIRVGTTFADVANLTTPEPTSFVLLGMGAMSMLLLGRRK
jgi:hypothetical protein